MNKPTLSDQEVQEIEAILAQYIDLPGASTYYSSEKPINAYEALKEALKDQIAYLIANRFETLLNILYRIDVPEASFQQVIREASSENIPERIAELLIQRQMEKIKWREWFRNKQSSSD